MYWTLELASKLEDAPWPATKEELIDYAYCFRAPLKVTENLQEMEDKGKPTNAFGIYLARLPQQRTFFNEEEYLPF